MLSSVCAVFDMFKKDIGLGGTLLESRFYTGTSGAPVPLG